MTAVLANKVQCYAKLAVSSPAVVETIGSTDCTIDGMTKLGGHKWPG